MKDQNIHLLPQEKQSEEGQKIPNPLFDDEFLNKWYRGKETHVTSYRYYVVFKGHQPGIYDNWPETEQQIIGFSGCKQKAFDSLGDAVNALKEWLQRESETEETNYNSTPEKQSKEKENSAIPVFTDEFMDKWYKGKGVPNAKRKYYLIMQGTTPGIYDKLNETLKITKDFSGTKYLTYECLEDAVSALRQWLNGIEPVKKDTYVPPPKSSPVF